jgi:hypothetical protein
MLKKHAPGRKWTKPGEINSTHFLPEAASNLLTMVTDIKICQLKKYLTEFSSKLNLIL